MPLCAVSASLLLSNRLFLPKVECDVLVSADVCSAKVNGGVSYILVAGFVPAKLVPGPGAVPPCGTCVMMLAAPPVAAIT